MSVGRIGHRSYGSMDDPRPIRESVVRKLPFVCLKQRPEIRRNMRKGIRLYLFKP